MSPFKYILCASLLLFMMSGCGTAVVKQPRNAATIQASSQDADRVVKYRKNIEDLDAGELAAYEHAVKMMKEKSSKNIYDRTGFLWQAWVHNCNSVDVLEGREASLSEAKLKKLLGNYTLDSCNIRNFLSVKGSAKTHMEHPGECEHQKNIFLQWHRAELYYYEQALRNADPEGNFGPSTKNVSLPYWNFTERPSGKRFPKVFENPNSPLYDATRNTALLPSSLPTASPYLLSYLIYYQDWTTFGGDEYGSNNGGDLETKIHNQMHATYVGGNMSDNTKAGLDPIFYVFHNFLDYSLEKWIEVNGEEKITGSGRENYLRAEQDVTLPKAIGFSEGTGEPKRSDSGDYTINMGQAHTYFDTKKQGYGFQPSRDGEFIAKEKIQALIDEHQAAGFVFGDNEKSLFAALLSYGSSGLVANPQAKITSEFTIPSTPLTPADAYLIFSRMAVKPDYDFQADVYLYPSTVTENINDAKFRNRYLVTNTAHWALNDHHAFKEITVIQQVADIVNSLVDKNKGQVWNITVAISGDSVEPAHEKDFKSAYIGSKFSKSSQIPHLYHEGSK